MLSLLNFNRYVQGSVSKLYTKITIDGIKSTIQKKYSYVAGSENVMEEDIPKNSAEL